jgi:hypothetical protein
MKVAKTDRYIEMGTLVTKMAILGRYDVLRSSRTTWVICECVLLQADNQPNQTKKTIKFLQGECKSETNQD